MLTRRTRRCRPTAAPSRGRLSVHDYKYTHIAPGKSTVSASCDLQPQPPPRQYSDIRYAMRAHTRANPNAKQYSRIVLKPTSTSTATRYLRPTTISYKRPMSLPFDYMLIRYYFIVRTISYSSTIRLLPHHAHGSVRFDYFHITFTAAPAASYPITSSFPTHLPGRYSPFWILFYLSV